MPKIKINNINLYYETYGQGTPLVFISGFSADHTIWKSIIAEYQKNYQIILLDNRGVGQSDHPEDPFTVETMADDVVELCRALSLKHCHFVGSSMGGAIVQTIAYKYPNFVRSAIIYNSFSKVDIKFHLYTQARLNLFKSQSYISNEALIKINLGFVFSSPYLNQPGVVDTLIQTSLANPFPATEIGYRNQLSALEQFDSYSWLNKINVPCLVIGSDMDQIVTEPHMRHLAERIPNSSYHCFNGVGHLPHMEQPSAFNELVLNYLAIH